jgi:hypothetical protein
MLGWQGPLPEPFAMTSGRRFNLPEGTIALHPGCKIGWPWKKWHGFDELARLLPQVAVIGTAGDLDNRASYFARPFDWPGRAQDFVGKLSLGDTGALIGQCAALVSNDSGMMHLGVALGVPTFGIFGITSPQREAIPSRWMTPISKGLPCEAPCRQQAWGRRDCEHHLECLKIAAARARRTAARHAGSRRVGPGQLLRGGLKHQRLRASGAALYPRLGSGRGQGVGRQHRVGFGPYQRPADQVATRQ